jgi:hypothetical protein
MEERQDTNLFNRTVCSSPKTDFLYKGFRKNPRANASLHQKEKLLHKQGRIHESGLVY